MENNRKFKELLVLGLEVGCFKIKSMYNSVCITGGIKTGFPIGQVNMNGFGHLGIVQQNTVFGLYVH